MTTTNQIWKPVKGYEQQYEVSNNGIIRSVRHRFIDRNGKTRFTNSKVLQQRPDRAGYYTIRLSKEGKAATHYVHRILAIAFILKPDGKDFVNHINGNKQDNRLKNLEWCTHAENVQHAYSSGLIKCKTKHVVDRCTGHEFSNVKEAAAFYGINYGTLRNYLNGNIKHNPTCLEYRLVA